MHKCITRLNKTILKLASNENQKMPRPYVRYGSLFFCLRLSYLFPFIYEKDGGDDFEGIDESEMQNTNMKTNKSKKVLF